MRCPAWRSRSAGAGEYRDRSEEKKRGEPKACPPARAEELGGVHLRATRRKLIIRRFACAEAAEVWPPFAPMLELAHPLGSTQPYARLDATTGHARHAARRYGALSPY